MNEFELRRNWIWLSLPCLRVTDLRKKPGGTLRPRWTGFTSMRVQGRMVSVSKWQVNCPNNSHSAFVIPTAIEISWVVGIWYSLDHAILVIPLWLLKPFQFQTSNQKVFFFLISLLYWIRFIQLWWSFLKIWRRFCLMTNIQWILLSWQMTVNKVELNFSWYYPCFSRFLNHPDFASPTFQTTSRTFQSSLNHLFSSFPSDLTSHTKVQSTMEIACFGIYSTVTRARLRH